MPAINRMIKTIAIMRSFSRNASENMFPINRVTRKKRYSTLRKTGCPADSISYQFITDEGALAKPLHDFSNGKQYLLPKPWPDCLKPNWKACIGCATGDRDRRYLSNVRGGTVKRSERYIATGSFAFSPILNAGVGVVGVMIAS